MADWEFNIWLGDPPSDKFGSYDNAVLLRSYKRLQWVTVAILKISKGLEAQIEVKLNNTPIILIFGKR